jgi:membrane dipeptidase
METPHASWNVSARATALHRDALVWDNHGCMPFEDTERWLEQLERYRASGVDVAVINIGDADYSLETLIRMAATVRDYVARHPDRYVLAVDTAAIRAAKATGKLAIALDVEGVYALGSQVSLVPLLYDLGVRWMLMVYNRANLAGSGCHDVEDGGLTPLGRELVREMDRVGLVKCCSHTGYRTAMQILELSSRPTIFSHSNPRALRDHPRNIPDELIDACARTGGVVCINGIGIFLGDNDIRVERFVDHIDYVVQRAGPAHVGLGLDYVFDRAGMDAALAGAERIWPEGFGYRAGIKFLAPEQLPAVTEELLRRGYDEGSIRGILGSNLLRVADAVWRR